jgi:hypothetical protein
VKRRIYGRTFASLIPGGFINPDLMRQSDPQDMVAFNEVAPRPGEFPNGPTQSSGPVRARKNWRPMMDGMQEMHSMKMTGNTDVDFAS